MRIGVNCFLLQPDVGGIKQYFVALFDELLSGDYGHEYIFFYFEHNLDELNKLRFPQWREKAILLRDQLEVRRHLEKIDLYFCPFGSLWPRPLNIPTVVNLADIQEVHYPQFFSDGDLYARAYHYVGSTKMADRVVTVSDFSRRTIVKFHDISPDKIDVAHNCIHPKYLQGDAQPLKVDLPETFVFFPANRWRHKNHDALLKAIGLLKKEYKIDISLVCTGYDIEGGYPLAAKAEAYGIADRVFSVGYVSIEEMVFLYRKAKMLVFPSLYEGFGIPLVEAMAVGCPVISSDATSLREVGGDAALFFDPRSVGEIAARIKELLENENLRVSLIEKGYERAKFFSPAKMAETHLRAFALAKRSFSSRRYLWLNYLYRPWHFLKVAVQHRNYLYKMKFANR
jgi:glycosyltransferase involved in cell wall biosynthesis